MSKLKAKDPKAAEPSKPKILIFGSFGVSKTWGALSFPNAYFIDTEGGANIKEYTDRLKNSGGRYMGPEDGANDLAEITNQVQALSTEKHDYKTLIIDSITKPFMDAITSEAARLEAAKMKNEFGTDKKPAVRQLRRLMMWLDKLDMNIVLIAREKAKWIDGKQTGFSADIHEDVNYDLNLVLRISKNGEARLATVYKTRLAKFQDGDAFLWSASGDVNDKTALNEFIARMGSGIMDSAKPVQLATPEQVGEIQRLVSLIKIEEAEIEKVMAKAKAETWYDLTHEQAVSVIEWLNKKLK